MKNKKCPFCGNKDVDVSDIFYFTFYVSCLKCGTMGPDGITLDEAWDLWNKRKVKGR